MRSKFITDNSQTLPYPSELQAAIHYSLSSPLADHQQATRFAGDMMRRSLTQGAAYSIDRPLTKIYLQSYLGSFL